MGRFIEDDDSTFAKEFTGPKPVGTTTEAPVAVAPAVAKPSEE